MLVPHFFSADVETDGPIPGPYSMLSFALVVAGVFDGRTLQRAIANSPSFYAELCPISESFEPEAMAVNGLDRTRLLREGRAPGSVMLEATRRIEENANGGTPVLVAYPLSFDWTWLYWCCVQFANKRSPFNLLGGGNSSARSESERSRARRAAAEGRRDVSVGGRIPRSVIKPHSAVATLRVRDAIATLP